MDRLAPSHTLHVRWGLISIEGKICLLEEQQCETENTFRYVSQKPRQCFSSIFKGLFFNDIMHHNETVADILIIKNLISIYNRELTKMLYYS